MFRFIHDCLYFIPILVDSQAEFVMNVKFRRETGKREILENLLSERLCLLMDGGDQKMIREAEPKDQAAIQHLYEILAPGAPVKVFS